MSKNDEHTERFRELNKRRKERKQNASGYDYHVGKTARSSNGGAFGKGYFLDKDGQRKGISREMKRLMRLGL